MTDRIEEQPYDDRHNTPPSTFFTGPGIELPERGKSQSYHQGGVIAPEHMTYSRVWPSVSGPGLHFIAADAVPFTDMARTLTEPDQLENVHEVDLRTMLAHLDSVARAITRELEARGLGGRR